MKSVAKWVKQAAPPVPLSFEVKGGEGPRRTESLADSLSEIHKFYTDLYMQSRCEANLSPPNLEGFHVDQGFDLEQELELLLKLTNELPANKGIGVDGWRNEELNRASPRAKHWLLRLFRLCVDTGRVPAIWGYCRLVCIPKPRKSGVTKLEDLRPLSVASSVYRLFSKWLLRHLPEQQDRVHPASVGGIRRRSAMQAWLPMAIRLENALANPDVLTETCFGFCIDTSIFFDTIEFPVAVQALQSIHVPEKYIRCWVRYLGQMQRVVTLSGSAHTESVSCMRGVPQGDPMSMLCATSCLAGWIEALSPYNTVSPKVYVDDRILLATEKHDELQEAFSHTQRWDQERGFCTRAKTTAFVSRRKNDFNPVWEDGEPVQSAEQCDYLGVPLLLPGVSREKWFNCKICKALDTLRLVIRSKIPFFTAGYIVASIVMPSLTAVAVVLRPTKQQIDSLRSLVVRAVFGKPLANTNACFLFLERMHALDPRWVFFYSSLCAWNRAFNCIADLASQVAHALSMPSPSRKKAAGPIALLLEDLQCLELQMFPDGCTVHDAQGQVVFKFGAIAKGELQHLLRERMHTCVIRQFDVQRPKWSGIRQVNLKATTSVARQQHMLNKGGSFDYEKHTLTSICRTLTNAHPTPYRLYLMHRAETPHCRLCDHDCGDADHILWHCPFFSSIRSQWPAYMHDRCGWHPCSLHILVCTTDLPPQLQHLWPRVQVYASQVISAWMHIQRLEDFSAYASDACLEQCSDHIAEPLEPPRLLPMRHACRNDRGQLDLEWQTPQTKAQLGFWGSSMRDWCLIFHFWTQWRHAEQSPDTRNWAWSEVTVQFLSKGGLRADFCAGCDTWAQLIWKMRMLSVKLLNDCLYDSEGDDPLQDRDSVEKWHISLPQERMLLAPITCNFSDSAVEILEVLDTMMAKISIDRPRATRKWVVEMSEIWPCISGLCADHLQDSESKLLPDTKPLECQNRDAALAENLVESVFCHWITS